MLLAATSFCFLNFERVAVAQESGDGTTTSSSSGGLVDGIKDFFHDWGNWLFPGSATNESDIWIIVWSDLDGYYWLEPDDSSDPSGDHVDYLFINGIWYKVSGIHHGHVVIGPDGIPYVPEHSTTPWPPSRPGALPTPVVVPDTPLTPVPDGDWIPLDSFPPTGDVSPF